MIAIRIYQDDLSIVFKSVVAVFLRNFQYLALNIGPILPLLAPFVLVLAQFVVRYGYEPLEVVTQEQAAAMMPGEGTNIWVKLKSGFEDKASQMDFDLPEGLYMLTEEAHGTADGVLTIEVVAIKPFAGELQVRMGNEVVATKAIVAGGHEQRTRLMQGERVSSFWASWIFPAEDRFDASCPVESISFVYPARQLSVPFMPAGEFGILLIFFIASMLFGVAVLKPLNITI